MPADPARREGGERLLPCPFCGAEPEVQRMDSETFGIGVSLSGRDAQGERT